jgi:hypothetical protein
MPGNAVFLDTNGWLALMNASDQLHQRADGFIAYGSGLLVK